MPAGTYLSRLSTSALGDIHNVCVQKTSHERPWRGEYFLQCVYNAYLLQCACDFTSNKIIPAKPTYGVYISQLVRIGRICDSFKAFNAKHTELTQRLMKQGFKYDKLCRKFKEFARKHNHSIKKFHVSVHKHIKQGISVPLKLSKKLARNVTDRRN